MIYFLRAGDNGDVKIGWTRDNETLKVRIETLQCGQSQRLIVIRTMDVQRWVEGWLHGFFSGYRLYGEWFSFRDEMLSIEPPDECEEEKSGSSSGNKLAVSIRLPPELWGRIRAYQARFEVKPSMAAIIETLIERGLRRSDRDREASDAKSVD